MSSSPQMSLSGCSSLFSLSSASTDRDKDSTSAVPVPVPPLRPPPPPGPLLSLSVGGEEQEDYLLGSLDRRCWRRSPWQPWRRLGRRRRRPVWRRVPAAVRASGGDGDGVDVRRRRPSRRFNAPSLDRVRVYIGGVWRRGEPRTTSPGLHLSLLYALRNDPPIIIGLGVLDQDADQGPPDRWARRGGDRCNRSTSSCGDDERKTLRMMKNRESALRSRARKRAYVQEVEKEVRRLVNENLKLRRQCKQLKVEMAALVQPSSSSSKGSHVRITNSSIQL